MKKLAIPNAFLSLSAGDEPFVEQVHRHLPNGLAFFYRKSFQSGETLLAEMERGVGDACVFVLFASAKSLASHWVKFEIDNARIQAITNPRFRLLVVPTEAGISASSLPNWMKAYWVGNVGRNAKDVARYIRNVVAEVSAGMAAGQRVLGRGALMDHLTRRLYAQEETTGQMPNVILVPGLAGIGRKTFIREALRTVLSTRPNLPRGPVIVLPQYCDLGDIYRALRELIEDNYTPDAFEGSWQAFNNLTDEQKVHEVVGSLAYFGALGQSVVLSLGNGLFKDDGSPKNWVLPLFSALHAVPDVLLCIASNRQISEGELFRTSNVVQLQVPPLTNPDTKALVSATFSDFGVEPSPVPTAIVEAIGGHPDVAKATVRLVSQLGPAILEREPHLLFHVQDEILAENLDSSRLTIEQSRVLGLLSWVPQLSDKLLMETLAKLPDFDELRVVYAIQDLVLSCIVQVAGDRYYISTAVRMMFRRRHGFGEADLLSAFSGVLQHEWQRAVDGDEDVSSDLLDSIAFMYALEGKALPGEFRSILPPAVLAEIISDVYNRARDNPDLFDRVIQWAAIGNELKCDEGTREEIFSYLLRARVFERQYPEAEKLLSEIDVKGYRSRHFLRGFYLRRTGDYDGAIPVLYRAVKERKFRRAAVHELALCLYRKKKSPELQALIDENKQWLEDSAFLLDFLIGTKLAAADFKDAYPLLEKLKRLPDDRGRSVRREAQLLMKRDLNFAGAVDLLTSAIQTGTGQAFAFRSTRAEAAAYAKQYEVSRRDIEFVERHVGAADPQVSRLRAHLYLAQSNYDGAIAELAKIANPDSVDELLRARVLDAKASDILTPLAERYKLQSQVNIIRGQHPPVDEIYIDLE